MLGHANKYILLSLSGMLNCLESTVEVNQIIVQPNISNIINFELCNLTVPDKLSFSSEIEFFHAIRFVCQVQEGKSTI